MQHPIHFHGQRFVVAAVGGKKSDNLVWKDSVLVAPGETVDIVLDASNVGRWMAHCHIAEHLGWSCGRAHAVSGVGHRQRSVVHRHGKPHLVAHWFVELCPDGCQVTRRRDRRAQHLEAFGKGCKGGLLDVDIAEGHRAARRHVVDKAAS